MPNDAMAATPEVREGTPGRSMVLAACIIATFMAAVESTIIATSIPTIVGELGGFDLFSWVFTIYLLTQAVSIPIYGRLADLYGRKPVFFVGAGLFLTGSTLCGLAWSMPSLVFFRAIQGFGAGAIQPIAATILGDIYTPTERAKIQGLISSVFGVAAVIGPSLGAFLIQHFHWQVVFWVNLPIGVAAVAMIALFLKERVQHREHHVDWLGSVLLFVAFGGLMLAVVQGNSLGHDILWTASIVGGVALVALLIHEARVREPMLPLELWRNRIIVTGSLGSCGTGATMMGVSAFLPSYVQGTMGYSAIAGGLVLGAMSVSWAIASIIGGRIMVRTSYRLVAVLGAVALAAGCFMLTLLSPADGPIWAAVASFIMGIGMGFANTVFIVAIQASVPWRQRGAATSSNMFLRFVGQAVGAAGCGAVLNATMIGLDPSAPRAVNKLMDTASRAAMPADEITHLTGVMAASLHNAYLLALAFSLITLIVASCITPRLSPRHQTTRN